MSGLSLYRGDSQASKNTCVNPQVQGLQPEDPSARPTRPPPPPQLLSHPPLCCSASHPEPMITLGAPPPSPLLPLGTVYLPCLRLEVAFSLTCWPLLIPTSHPRLLPSPAPGPYPEGVDKSISPPTPGSPGRFLPLQHIPRGPCTLLCNLFTFAPHPFLRLS